MKTLLIALTLAASFSTQATSILVFRTVTKCETITKVKNKEVLVDIQKAQDGQVQLVITLDKQTEQKIQAKEILPPRMMAGAPLKYVGKDTGTDNKVTLAITSGTAPVKVGKVVGRYSKLTIENVLTELPLVCASVTK
jgi:hypothetical protein